MGRRRRRIHIVDLDAAKAGQPVNLEAIARIRDAVDVKSRSAAASERSSTSPKHSIAASIGSFWAPWRSGTAPLVERAAKRWGDAIAVSLDARDGKLAAAGWTEQTELVALDLARDMNKAGVTRFIYTDINRDGTHTGPNTTAIRELVLAVNARVISAGGVGAIEDVEALRDTGAHGAIIGRALYDGRVDLRAAIAKAGSQS
ncbi:MAG: HisA/HisF-related TIM barrel protein [Thermomicrobiales bacterium]